MVPVVDNSEVGQIIGELSRAHAQKGREGEEEKINNNDKCPVDRMRTDRKYSWIASDNQAQPANTRKRAECQQTTSLAVVHSHIHNHIPPPTPPPPTITTCSLPTNFFQSSKTLFKHFL
eukprot:scpid104323/ scgid20236/ 